MEKIIIFGRVFSFTSKKTGDSYYKLDYLNSETGEAKSDYLNINEYSAIKSQDIPVGTTVVGICKENSYGHLYVSSISKN